MSELEQLRKSILEAEGAIKCPKCGDPADLSRLFTLAPEDDDAIETKLASKRSSSHPWQYVPDEKDCFLFHEMVGLEKVWFNYKAEQRRLQEGPSAPPVGPGIPPPP